MIVEPWTHAGFESNTHELGGALCYFGLVSSFLPPEAQIDANVK